MTPWTQDEDNVLLQQIAVYGTKDQWRQIAEAIPGRTNKACRKRWLHSLSPDVKKTLWSAEEDAALLALHAAHPGRWAAIARGIPGRTDDACSKRYREALDPALRKDGWSAREDEELLEMVARFEGRWTKVGQAMSRSSLACRNRYRMLQRKIQMQTQTQTPTPNAALTTTATTASTSTSTSTPTPSPSPIESDHIQDLQQHSDWPAASDAPVDASLALGWGGFPYASQLMPSWQVTAHQQDTAVFAIDPSLQQQPLELHLQTELDAPSGSGASALSSPQDDHDGPPPFYQHSDVDYGRLDLHDDMEVDMQHVYASPDVQALDEQHSQDMQLSPTTPYSEDGPVPPPDAYVPVASLDLDSGGGGGASIPDGAGSSSPSTSTSTTAAHARPAKRRRVEAAATSRLSSVRAVTSDAATLAYACGHAACWPLVEREMHQQDSGTRASTVRFATSADLMAHKKAAHPGAAEDKIFRCALPGCGKAWKNINGIQYHLQVSRAHFRTAVNRVKCTTTNTDTNAGPGDQGHLQEATRAKAAELGRPKKLYTCPRDGCPNRYKQLSGLKYHLTHGHPENPPLQLDELPHQLRRQLGAVAPVA